MARTRTTVSLTRDEVCAALRQFVGVDGAVVEFVISVTRDGDDADLAEASVSWDTNNVDPTAVHRPITSPRDVSSE